MSHEDPLLAALSRLESPLPEPGRADAIRRHVRELVEPASPPVVLRVARFAAPVAMAAYILTYLGWTVQRVSQRGPFRVLSTRALPIQSLLEGTTPPPRGDGST